MASTYPQWNGNNNNNNRKWSECEVWCARTWVRSSGWNKVRCYICSQCSKAKLGISRPFESKSSTITHDKMKALRALLELKEAMLFRGRNAHHYWQYSRMVRRAKNWIYEVLSIVAMLIIDVLGEQCQSTHKLSVNNLIDCRAPYRTLPTNLSIARLWPWIIDDVWSSKLPVPGQTKRKHVHPFDASFHLPLNNWEDYAIPFREVRASQFGVSSNGAHRTGGLHLPAIEC